MDIVERLLENVKCAPNDGLPSLLDVIAKDCKEAAAEIERLRDELETERLRLAACSTAALGNTENSVAQRIGRDNPYWSASYGDVCDAVDREMDLRRQVLSMTNARGM